MINTLSFVAILLATTPTIASGASMRAEAASMPDGSWPTSQGNEYFDEPYTIKSGEVYDGNMMTFQRSNIKCSDQRETGWRTSVFRVEAGGTLKNVIIGKDQTEGVHCVQGDCTIENVWWEDVCEDGLSVMRGSSSSVAKVIGGGARSAVDKVVQHNGGGTVSIEGFYVEDFGQLYRSCGTCGEINNRRVIVKNVYAVNGHAGIVKLNQNLGDHATLENIRIEGKRIDVCSWTDGTSNGDQDEAGAGPSGDLCDYSPSTITYV